MLSGETMGFESPYGIQILPRFTDYGIYMGRKTEVLLDENTKNF